MEGRLIEAARGRVVAALAARFRDLDLAEEAFAEAAASAVEAWRRDFPDDPPAWLWRTACRKALDAVRRANTRKNAVHDAPPPEPTPEDAMIAADQPIPDERLRLIFVCCHPALDPAARIALTLKIVLGLSTDRLARAFLVAEPAMLQRITRAKQKIAVAGVPFEIPGPAAWPERLDAVLSTLEVAYAQAYEDAALTTETAAAFAPEVLRLSGLLADLLPGEPEVLALAALIRFAEARRPARLDDTGAMVPLSLQEPHLWRGDRIAEGAQLLDRAADLARPGPRQILAAIHGAHLSRQETGVTPWGDIARLYDALVMQRPGPVSEVNRAVAYAEAYDPDTGLRAFNAIPPQPTWLPWQAARAWLLDQTGQRAAAASAYDAALALGPPPAERLYLDRQRRRLG
ncbi:MAG: polymerase subunit sigma-24 [Caulobacter sp.]|nr:polymerase subunit sigma-24 [Caulobacter sp.]